MFEIFVLSLRDVPLVLQQGFAQGLPVHCLVVSLCSITIFPAMFYLENLIAAVKDCDSFRVNFWVVRVDVLSCLYLCICFRTISWKDFPFPQTCVGFEKNQVTYAGVAHLHRLFLDPLLGPPVMYIAGHQKHIVVVFKMGCLEERQQASFFVYKHVHVGI